MLVRTSVCALALTALLASPSLAQQRPTTTWYANAIPLGSAPPTRIDIGRGRLDFQTPAQQARVEKIMPQIERAVTAQLDNPDKAELRSLRTGRYQKAMVVCGVVDSIATSGETEKRRFIARPSIATLETAENSRDFRAGWKSTGCGF